MRIIIIGAGPSGLMCAGECSKNNGVIVIDQNEKPGKKLYITGKGRCNVTNNTQESEFLENVVTNQKFLYSAIYSFPPSKTIEFFENNKVRLKTERGNRVFPESDKASDITKALYENAINNGTKFRFNEKVKTVYKNQDVFYVTTNLNTYPCDSIVICCGGASYKMTGSDASINPIIEKFGHKIVLQKPALCPIILKDSWVKKVEGLSLKNVSLTALNNNKVIKSIFGEMIFTNKGISGPIALTLSSYINTYNTLDIVLDFKPALNDEKLFDRIERECLNFKNNEISTMLKSLLPKNLVPIFLDKLTFKNKKLVKSLTEKDKKEIVFLLKNFYLNFSKLDDINFAIVTSGGVSTKEINPKTMESKLIKNLYFAGEIIDVDALTGGFNIQIALSTGYLCGNNLKEKGL